MIAKTTTTLSTKFNNNIIDKKAHAIVCPYRKGSVEAPKGLWHRWASTEDSTTFSSASNADPFWGDCAGPWHI